MEPEGLPRSVDDHLEDPADTSLEGGLASAPLSTQEGASEGAIDDEPYLEPKTETTTTGLKGENSV